MSKIAIAKDGNQVSAHFGRCPTYLFVEIENQKIIKREELSNPGHARGAIPRFIHEQNADAIICGGMGFRAQQFFQEYGIKPIIGVQCSVDDAIEGYIEGTLEIGESSCQPGGGKNYGVPRSDLDESHHHHHHNPHH